MNNQQKQQVIEQVKAANNVLVAVSSNPTVDELAASVGLTLALNKLGKHATTVFSGIVPSTIEFLQPEKTIETTTDSLRDFIIALDKSKADKLRYKVEDNVVRIFITPYRTSITDKDLEFSQGDFNVDVVLALGVTRQDDLDKAITAHGRILHDATVISVSNKDMPNELGAMNWQDVQASSLCEMVASIMVELLPEGMDGQMATALLTGIIAETDRFKNQKTTPLALSLSSQLMSAGANQQLIAEKLDEPEAAPELQHIVDERDNPPKESADGTLEIEHDAEEVDKIHIDEHGNLGLHDEEEAQPTEVTDYENEQSNDYVQETTDNPSDAFFASPTSEDNSVDIEKPTLQQPDSTDTPMMAHQKVITPPFREGDIPKTDKPFDLAEAMATEATNQYEEVSTPDMPEPASAPEPEQTIEEPVSIPEPIIESIPEPMTEPVVSEPEPLPLPQPLPQPEPVMSAPEVVMETEPEQETMPIPVSEPIPIPAPETPSPANDSLAELEKAIGSTHAAVNPPLVDEPSSSIEPLIPVDPSLSLTAPENTVEHSSLEPPKVDSGEDDVVDPNAPPAVPPPMTPQFYDSDGNNANPFLNPHQ